MKKILIVEDELSQRQALHINLEQRGYVVLEARDGLEGLEVALRAHPDLVLLDIRMPGMDGMTMMHRLREHSWGKKAPIIILTNYDNDDNQLRQIIIDQPSYYLIKSNTPIETVIDKIEEVLEVKENKR